MQSKAGHQELGPALRDEILAFYLTNQRFPDPEEIDAIKDIVSDRVFDAVKKKVGCWSGFWSSQDRLIGVAGDENTLFTASAIREMSGKEPTDRQTPIRGKETALVPGPFGVTTAEVEHHYVLHWNMEVDPVFPVAKTEFVAKIEEVGTKLEELELAIEGLVGKLRAADKQLGTNLQVDIEEKVKRVRPTLVQEFQIAWAEFAKTLHGDYGDRKR